MCKIDDTTLFLQLHQDYFTCTDDKIKRNLKNAILLHLIPLLEHIVNKFNLLPTIKEDLFQDLVVKVLEANSLVDKWKPTNSSIEGYYRRCLFRKGINWVKTRKLWFDKEISMEPEAYYWEVNGIEDTVHTLHSDFSFADKDKQKIYTLILSLMTEGTLTTGRDAYVEELSKKSLIQKAELKRLYTHALIICREHYLEHASNNLQELDSETLFGRLSEHLTAGQISDIVKVFGGCKVKIPRWVN